MTLLSVSPRGETYRLLRWQGEVAILAPCDYHGELLTGAAVVEVAAWRYVADYRELRAIPEPEPCDLAGLAAREAL